VVTLARVRVLTYFSATSPNVRAVQAVGFCPATNSNEIARGSVSYTWCRRASIAPFMLLASSCSA
jgi:hypothetical protein